RRRQPPLRQPPGDEPPPGGAAAGRGDLVALIPGGHGPGDVPAADQQRRALRAQARPVRLLRRPDRRPPPPFYRPAAYHPPCANHQATNRHLGALLLGAGISWLSYQEDMAPGTCPLLTNNGALYAPKHDPFVFFDDLIGGPPPNCTGNGTDPTCVAH